MGMIHSRIPGAGVLPVFYPGLRTGIPAFEINYFGVDIGFLCLLCCVRYRTPSCSLRHTTDGAWLNIVSLRC